MKLDVVSQPDSQAVDELNRLLEIGKLLVSVLTEDELATLHILIGVSDKEQSSINIGNASVT